MFCRLVSAPIALTLLTQAVPVTDASRSDPTADGVVVAVLDVRR